MADQAPESIADNTVDSRRTAVTEVDSVAIDILAVARRVWRKRVLILILGLAGGVAGIGYSYTQPEKFEAVAVLLPQGAHEGTGLFDRLARLSGENIGSGGIDESLYGIVLGSDRVLDRFIEHSWIVSGVGDTLSLRTLLSEETAADPADRVSSEEAYALKRTLREEVIGFDRDPMAGVMRVTVTVPRFPALAATMANFLVAELDTVQNLIATKRARAHRVFVENRLAVVEAQLVDAEELLTGFLVGNNNYQSSPELRRRYGELEREVQAFQSVWLQLRSELEQAIVEENRYLDPLKILDVATPPHRRVSPNRVLYGLLGGLMTVLLGIGGQSIYLRFVK